ncbi:MAG: hypothetical protein FJ039_12115 [Chloroflexi bacterium]|nr:hypothetical protein [Chloroflexota bacterium]
MGLHRALYLALSNQRLGGGFFMTGHLYALRGAFLQQARSIKGISDWLFSLASSVGTVAVLAWIAGKSNSEVVLAYIALGSFMYAIWQRGVFDVGWSLADEMRAGTFEYSVLSRSESSLIMLGKALAHMTRGFMSGAVAFFLVLLITHHLLSVADLLMLLISVTIAIFALIAGSFLFAPLMVLASGRGGFFNIFIAFGGAFSGFYYPVARLPAPVGGHRPSVADIMG